MGESIPAHLGPAKGETGRGSGTVTSTKCKAEVGSIPLMGHTDDILPHISI